MWRVESRRGGGRRNEKQAGCEQTKLINRVLMNTSCVIVALQAQTGVSLNIVNAPFFGRTY